jgi:hypothetical protein
MEAERAMATVQVRMYVVKDGSLDAFVGVFREHLIPLRAKFGFTVLGAWTVPEESRFIWVAGYDGPGTIQEAHERYYASPDRLALRPDPATMLAEVRAWFATPVDVT